MNYSNRFFLPKLLAVGISIGFAASTQGAEIEEVVVTAQKRSQNLQDVPVAVSALDNETMKSKGVTEDV